MESPPRDSESDSDSGQSASRGPPPESTRLLAAASQLYDRSLEQMDLLDHRKITDPVTGTEYQGFNSESAPLWKQHFENVETLDNEHAAAKETLTALQQRIQNVDEGVSALREKVDARRTLVQKKLSNDIAEAEKKGIAMINKLLTKHPSWLPEVAKVATTIVQPLEQSLDEASGTLEKLEQGTETIRASQSELQEQIEGWRESVARLQAQGCELASDHEKLLTEHSETQRGYQSLKEQAATAAAEYEDLDRKYKALNIEHASVKSQHTGVQQAHDELKGQNNSLRQENERLLSTQHALSSEKQSLAAKLQDKTLEYDKLLGEKKTIEANFEKNVKDSQKSFNELLSERDSLRSDKETLARNLAELDSRYCQVVSSSAAISKELSGLKLEYEHLEAGKEAMTEHHSKLTAENRDLKSEHEQLKSQKESLDGQYMSLAAEHRDLKSEHELLKSQNESVTEQYMSLTVEHRDQKLGHEQLHSEHESLQKQHGDLAVEHQKLREQLSGESFAVNRLQQELKQSKNEAESLQKQGESKEASIDGLNHLLNVAHAEVAGLRGDLEQHRSAAESANLQIKAKDSEMSRLQTELSATKNQNGRMKEEAESRLQELENQIRDIDSSNQTLRSQNATLQACVHEKRVQLSASEDELQRALGELDEVAVELEDVKEDRDLQIRLLDEAHRSRENVITDFTARLERLTQRCTSFEEVLQLVEKTGLDCVALQHSWEALKTLPPLLSANLPVAATPNVAEIEGLTCNWFTEQSALDQAWSLFLSAHSRRERMAVSQVQCFVNGLAECDGEVLSSAIPLLYATAEKMVKGEPLSFNSSLIWLTMLHALRMYFVVENGPNLLAALLQRAQPKLCVQRLLPRAMLQQAALLLSGDEMSLGDSIIAVATEHGSLLEAGGFWFSIDGQYLIVVTTDKQVGIIRPNQVKVLYKAWQRACVLVFEDAPITGSCTLQIEGTIGHEIPTLRKVRELCKFANGKTPDKEVQDLSMYGTST